MSPAPGLGRTARRLRLLQLSALWWVLDMSAALLGVMAAYGIRFASPFTRWVPVTKGVPEPGAYVLAGLALGVLWTLAFRSAGLYDARGRRAEGDIAAITRASVVATLLAGGLSFFYRGFSFSRVVMPLTWVCGWLAVIGLRRAASWVLRRAVREPWTRVAVVGTGPMASYLARDLVRRAPVGHVFCGVIGERGDLAARREGEGLPWLGALADLDALAARHRLNHLLVALPWASAPELPARLAALHAAGVDIEFVPEVAELLPAHPVMTSLAGVPLIGLRESPLSGWKIAAKRAVDIGVSAALLVVLSPVLAVLALIVKLDSPGPVFYAQERVGRDLQRFAIYKFRTMVVDAEPGGAPQRAVARDPRRTRSGRVLRRFSLDELPQLWNVLRGDMSLVGPRPERPAFVADLERTIPDYFVRHRVKSGMTGWAQIHDLRGDADFEERTLYDLYYVEHWSLALDATIVARTVGAVLESRHAV